jgi:hypothetical protein
MLKYINWGLLIWFVWRWHSLFLSLSIIIEAFEAFSAVYFCDMDLLFNYFCWGVMNFLWFKFKRRCVFWLGNLSLWLWALLQIIRYRGTGWARWADVSHLVITTSLHTHRILIISNSRLVLGRWNLVWRGLARHKAKTALSKCQFNLNFRNGISVIDDWVIKFLMLILEQGKP